MFSLGCYLISAQKSIHPHAAASACTHGFYFTRMIHGVWGNKKEKKKRDKQSMNDTLDLDLLSCVKLGWSKTVGMENNQYSTVSTKSEDDKAKIQG